MSMKIEDKLFLDRFKVDEESHLRIIDGNKCVRCKDKPCLNFCPAYVYRLEDEDRVSIHHEGCLECGSCRIACTEMNIEWRFPRGGYGISHKFG